MTDTRNDDEFVEVPTVTAPVEGEGDAPPAADDKGDPPAEDGEAADGEGEGDKPEGDEEGEGDDKPPLQDDKGKPKSGAEARIGELTRLRREAERSAEYWKGIATRNGAQSGDDAAPTAEPSPDDFDDYGDYVKAITKWTVAQDQRATADTRATEAAKVADEHRGAEWNAKIGAAKSVLPDFDAVMETADTPTASHVAAAIMDAERGPELLYHLAGNPEIVERLNEMSPARAAMELGKIEATLGEPAAPPPPPPKRTTTAPAPITPVKPGSTTAKDPAKMNMDEYKAYRESQGIQR